MGKDLYFIKTPLLEEEKLVGLELSTWHFLAELFGKEDVMDLENKELTKLNKKELFAAMISARSSGNQKLAGDIQCVLFGIEKYDSITLVIRS